MKPNTKDGGPAFPCHGPNGMVFNHGMSLHDWFAGMALQGWLAGPCAGDVLDCYDGNPEAFAQHQAKVAQACYEYADAMLAARKEAQITDIPRTTAFADSLDAAKVPKAIREKYWFAACAKLERHCNELLEALEEFVEGQVENRPCEYSDALGSARTAIAKAKGDTP